MNVLKKMIPKSIKVKIKSLMGLQKSIDIDRITEDIAKRKAEALLEKSSGAKMQGKIALVTGATGFIGAEIVKRLASQGATVFCGTRNTIKAQALVQELSKNENKVFPIEIEVTDEVSIKNTIEKIVSEWGKIDVLVNCAGGSARDDWNYIYNQNKETIDNIIDTNLKGAIFCSKWAAKNMLNNKYGRIINISSTVGVGGKSGFSDYAASKAGVIGFTKSLALELGEYGITVNCVTPGIVFRGTFTKENIKTFTEKNAMASLGIANDIAYAVSFFAAEEASFITGQNLIVDGGRSLGLKGD